MGAAAPGANLTTLVYPGAQTLFTIAHSTFGDQVVGNYDTQLATGNAFVYTISTGAYVTNNFPGAISTTAYGVWGNVIAGGYSPLGVGNGAGLDRGYIYNETTGLWTSYNYPARSLHISRASQAEVRPEPITWSPTGPEPTAFPTRPFCILPPMVTRPGSISMSMGR